MDRNDFGLKQIRAKQIFQCKIFWSCPKVLMRSKIFWVITISVSKNYWILTFFVWKCFNQKKFFHHKNICFQELFCVPTSFFGLKKLQMFLFELGQMLSGNFHFDCWLWIVKDVPYSYVKMLQLKYCWH